MDGFRRFQTKLNDKCNQKLKFSRYLLTLNPMESQIKFHSRANISGASQQNGFTAFSSMTSRWGLVSKPYCSSGTIQVSGSPTFLCKDIISALLKSQIHHCSCYAKSISLHLLLTGWKKNYLILFFPLLFFYNKPQMFRMLNAATFCCEAPETSSDFPSA